MSQLAPGPTTGSRKTRIAATAAVFLIVVLFGLTIQAAAHFYLVNHEDEELLPEIVEMQKQLNAESVPSDQNFFFTLFGFGAAEGNGDNAAGQRIVAQYQQTAAAVIDENADIYDLIAAKKLQFKGKPDSLCPDRGSPMHYRCVADAGRHIKTWRKLMIDNNVYLERYSRFPAKPRYAYKLDITGHEPFAPWGAVSIAKRLLISKLAIQVQQGNINAALETITYDTAKWRYFMSLNSTTLLDKLVSISHVGGNLLFVSELLKLKVLTSAQYSTINHIAQPLSIEERSLAGALKMESLNRINTTTHNAGRTINWKQSNLSDIIERGLTKLLVLPNATSNVTYNAFLDLGNASEESCYHFKDSIDALRQDSTDYVFDTYNIGGRKMRLLYINQYSHYLARMCGLDGLLSLVRMQTDIHQRHPTDGAVPAIVEAANSSNGAFDICCQTSWDPASRSLNFDIEDDRIRSMLPWPL